MPNKFDLVKIGLSLVMFVAVVFAASPTAKAETIFIVGNSTGSLATATVQCSFNNTTNTLTLSVTNTSPFDARITGIGFDLPPVGNASPSGLDGFAGNSPGGFTFRDGDLGNVPGFSAVLDFGWTTGPSGKFNGGFPNDGIPNAANGGGAVIFTVSGAGFAGFTETQICNSIYVRFQRVGENDGSDIGTPGTPVPEPASMFLLGSGLVATAAGIRRRHRDLK